MNSCNQASIFEEEESYFNPPKNLNSKNHNSSENISLIQAVEDFKLKGKAEGRADKTLEQYNYVFNRLLEQFTDDREAGSIQTRELRKYLAHLMDEGLKKTSVAIHYRNLNSLFNWLKGEGILESSPMNDIKEPKTPDKFPKILNKEQVDKLLNTARNWRRTWAGYRNFTMIVTFLDTGLRLDEFVNAELNNLNFEQRSIKVDGKGAKDRKVYFGKNTYKCLRHWLKIRDNINEIWDDNIFISQNGDRLKKRHVQRTISRIQKKAGLEEVQVSPHVLRHTAATLAVENGLDAFSLKRQFGWEQMRTALKYVHMSDKALQESYRNSSPMDNI